MENKTLFNSHALQIIDSETSDVFTNHLKKISNISEDINALENKLKKSGVPFQFFYVFLSEKKHTPFHYEKQDVEDLLTIITDKEQSLDHCLAWSKNCNGDYRLSYQLFIVNSLLFLENGKKSQLIENEKPKVKVNKPLIETKVNLRLKIENELPHFFRFIVDSLKNDFDKEIVIVHSPYYNEFVSPISLYHAENKDFLQNI